jgi:hypothetical protein
MDQVELVLVEPGVFGVIHNELEIGRDAWKCQLLWICWLRYVYHSQRRLARTEVNTCDLTLGVLVGCAVDQYMSEHVDKDKNIPKSIAQIPVPVPTSNAFLGFSMGEK